MTTSKHKAAGSAAERRVAALLGGVRVGMDGGPVDVIVPGYASVQVKTLRTLPSLNQVQAMIDAMPNDGLLRCVVVISRPGKGHKGQSTITFDLGAWVEWYGASDQGVGEDKGTHP